jgi:hypothetical protein
MSDRIDEIESRLREMGAVEPKAEPAAQPPVRDSGPGEGVPGGPGGFPAT